MDFVMIDLSKAGLLLALLGSISNTYAGNCIYHNNIARHMSYDLPQLRAEIREYATLNKHNIIEPHAEILMNLGNENFDDMRVKTYIDCTGVEYGFRIDDVRTPEVDTRYYKLYFNANKEIVGGAFSDEEGGVPEKIFSHIGTYGSSIRYFFSDKLTFSPVIPLDSERQPAPEINECSGKIAEVRDYIRANRDVVNEQIREYTFANYDSVRNEGDFQDLGNLGFRSQYDVKIHATDDCQYVHYAFDSGTTNKLTTRRWSIFFDEFQQVVGVVGGGFNTFEPLYNHLASNIFLDWYYTIERSDEAYLNNDRYLNKLKPRKKNLLSMHNDDYNQVMLASDAHRYSSPSIPKTSRGIGLFLDSLKSRDTSRSGGIVLNILYQGGSSSPKVLYFNGVKVGKSFTMEEKTAGWDSVSVSFMNYSLTQPGLNEILIVDESSESYEDYSEVQIYTIQVRVMSSGG